MDLLRLIEALHEFTSQYKLNFSYQTFAVFNRGRKRGSLQY